MKNDSKKNKISLIRGIPLFMLFMLCSLPLLSQNAGISSDGVTPPNAAAGLDVNFISGGILIPRVALISTTSISPLAAHVAGMVVYNTAAAGDVTPGFYYDNGTRWVASPSRASYSGEMQYWDGTKWGTITPGQPGQLLQVSSTGVPAWVGAGYPTLTTSVVTSITSATATSGGNISAQGGSPVTARGVCWATTADPTIAGSKTTDGAGAGSFISSVTGLAAGTRYYLRAYSTNGSGTAYGNQLVFITP